MEAWPFFQKGAGITADTGQGSVMGRHGALQLCTVRGMVPLLTQPKKQRRDVSLVSPPA